MTTIHENSALICTLEISQIILNRMSLSTCCQQLCFYQLFDFRANFCVTSCADRNWRIQQKNNSYTMKQETLVCFQLPFSGSYQTPCYFSEFIPCSISPLHSSASRPLNVWRTVVGSVKLLSFATVTPRWVGGCSSLVDCRRKGVPDSSYKSSSSQDCWIFTSFWSIPSDSSCWLRNSFSLKCRSRLNIIFFLSQSNWRYPLVSYPYPQNIHSLAFGSSFFPSCFEIWVKARKVKFLRWST